MSTLRQGPKFRRWIIGLTGGIASGKSTVLAEFARHHIPTLSADLLAREALRPKTKASAAVIKRFGSSICRAAGEIDRTKLAAVVFRSPTERRWLERLVHPLVVKRIRTFIQRQRGLAVIDIPLLFEAHLEGLVDEVLVVSTTRRNQVGRLRHRNGFSRTEANRRISAQWALSRKRRLGDYVIDNCQSRAFLKAAVERLLPLLRGRATR